MKEKWFWVNCQKSVFFFFWKNFFLQIIFFKTRNQNVFSFFKIKNKSVIFVSFENLRRRPLSYLHFNVFVRIHYACVVTRIFKVLTSDEIMFFKGIAARTYLLKHNDNRTLGTIIRLHTKGARFFLIFPDISQGKQIHLWTPIYITESKHDSTSWLQSFRIELMAKNKRFFFIIRFSSRPFLIGITNKRAVYIS